MPTRVAFVGESTSSATCVPHARAGGVHPRFFDFRGAPDGVELRAALEDWGAQVVVAIAPERLDPGALAGMRALRLGFVTEPVARRTRADAPAPEPVLERLDPEDFDRIASTDPLAGEVWRSLPLPVDDRLYAAVRPSARPPRVVFLGASTAHREHILVNAKHAFDVVHYAHGLHGDRLREVFARTDVALNVHAQLSETFESPLLAHLAAGHLLISEALAPTHGLEPGIDFVEIAGRDELLTVLHQLERRPDTFERLRHRGREKAEDYRASRVWPRLLGDLERDVRAFGRGVSAGVGVL